jgi:protoporphyrinogen oxidase
VVKANRETCKIHIIGAGVSGLTAALVLESNGFRPVIFEASDRIGGRLKTDLIDGYQMDHGFQVLLTAYPMAQKYLNFEQLELQDFLPGATIFINQKKLTIADPTREPSLLLSTLIANPGSLSDKIKIIKLHLALRKKSLEQIFNDPEISTLDYLKRYGFSDSIIRLFFRPFFSGIFLESALQTSSRMFEFVFKMFGSGLAALPKSGIAAIADQLFSKLELTDVRLNTPVRQVEDGKLSLFNGEVLQNHYTIIATEADQLVRNLSSYETKWHSCDNLYFETHERVIKKPLIGLVSDSEALINNIFYHTSLQTSTTPKNELLSVTVVKQHNFSINDLIVKVQDDLERYCGIKDPKFIRHYHIDKALPRMDDMKNKMLPSQTRLTETVYLAGDQMLNGSLNAAMNAGESAAMGIIEKQMVIHK